MPYIRGYLDFSKIEYVSTAAALVMASYYERARILRGETPPTIDLHLWNETVFNTLLEVGFFEIVGITKRPPELVRISAGARTTMQFVSGQGPSELRAVCEGISELVVDTFGSEMPELMYLRSAISEAITNVQHHAYPADHDFRFRHVDRWWATASTDKDNGSLKIVFYDQGASIPITYPRMSLGREVLSFLDKIVSRGVGSEFRDDAAYIEAAMTYGNSKTGSPERGEGLPQMKASIDHFGRGRLRIYSRSGVCTYEPNQAISRSAYAGTVGGTLIEWTIFGLGEQA